MSVHAGLPNLNRETVEGFGHEWRRFDQSNLSDSELRWLFARYFHVFPWTRLRSRAVGFDAGCGSGRWARLVAERGYRLHLVDASAEALAVAREKVRAFPDCVLHHASIDALPFDDESMDFGYSLGVLHHVPDPAAGIRACVRKLRPGAPFLVYLYYAFDQRPGWFRALWRASDVVRRSVSMLPVPLRHGVCDAIAAGVYWPLARAARLAARAGVGMQNFPLAGYRELSFYTMRTDALDRFGTPLELRFTADEVVRMLGAAGLDDIRLSNREPFWCAVGVKRASGS